ncbi:MAG TPA: hypothetical protein VK506_04970 [Conexibacter sp.]|nr:hypothetical protein [Conexibacter sp.]
MSQISLFDAAARDPDDLSDLVERPTARSEDDFVPVPPSVCRCERAIMAGPDADDELRCWRCGHPPRPDREDAQ